MSLTDDWKAGKLKNGWYFCLYENDVIFPGLCFDDDFDDCQLKVMEVLALCNYDELQRLKEEVANGDRIIGELLNEGNSARMENRQLRQLLKECRTAFETYAEEDESCGLDEENKYAKNLLPKINEVLK